MSEKISLDDIDRRILARLQENADLSISELAAAVGLSRNPCWRRVQRLEREGVIVRRVALLDRKKLNLPVTAFIFVRTDEHSDAWLELFARVVSDQPEITGFYRLAGEVDYLLHAVLPSIEAYDELYRRIIRQVRIKEISACFAMEEIKQTNALPLGYAG